MKYVLDTNVVIKLFKNDTIIKNTLEGIAFDGDDICISAITYYELMKGVNAIGKTKNFDDVSRDWKIILYDKLDTFERAAIIYDDLTAHGYNDEAHDADILIAAASLSQDNDTVLITYDKIFSRIDGLKIDAW